MIFLLIMTLVDSLFGKPNLIYNDRYSICQWILTVAIVLLHLGNFYKEKKKELIWSIVLAILFSYGGIPAILKISSMLSYGNKTEIAAEYLGKDIRYKGTMFNPYNIYIKIEEKKYVLRSSGAVGWKNGKMISEGEIITKAKKGDKINIYGKQSWLGLVVEGMELKEK